MNHINIDFNFGIKSVAFSVLHILNSMDVSKTQQNPEKLVLMSTSPWYNGRERGIALTISHSLGKTKVITFGEHRNSDSIFMDTWEMKNLPMNPPTLADMPKEAYENRTFFDPEAHYKAAEHIYALIKQFVNSNNK